MHSSESLLSSFEASDYVIFRVQGNCLEDLIATDCWFKCWFKVLNVVFIKLWNLQHNAKTATWRAWLKRGSSQGLSVSDRTSERNVSTILQSRCVHMLGWTCVLSFASIIILPCSVYFLLELIHCYLRKTVQYDPERRARLLWEDVFVLISERVPDCHHRASS